MATTDYQPERDLKRSPVATVTFALAALGIVAIVIAPTVASGLPLSGYLAYLAATSALAIAGLYVTDRKLREVAQ